MSQDSDASCNYNEIITSFINSKRQWKQVPEIVLLVIKAIYSHSQQIQDNLYAQRQILSEQSIKYKQLALQIAELKAKNQSSWLDYESVHAKQSAFKKKRIQVDGSHYGKNQAASKSRRRGKAEDSPNTKRKDFSINIDHGLNQTMIEEVRALIQATLSQHNQHNQHKNNKNSNSDIEMELQNIRKQIRDKKQSILQELDKKIQTNTATLLTKLHQHQHNLTQKLQNQRKNTLNFAQQSSLSIQKILSQINNIHIRICELTQQNQKTYSNPKNTKKLNSQNQKVNQLPVVGSNNKVVENKMMEMVNTISRQFGEWKMKVMKQMAVFVKSEDFQGLMNSFQSQNVEKINKISKNVAKLSKQIQNIKQQTNKTIIKPSNLQIQQQSSEYEQQKPSKYKNSQKSLQLIQQSLSRLQGHFKQKLKASKKQLTDLLQKRISQNYNQINTNFHNELQIRQRTLCELIESNCQGQNLNLKPQQYSFNNNSGILEMRAALAKITEQMLVARYIHLGGRPCKDVIEWEKNVVNFMEENYVWKVNSHAVVVMAAGLYRVQAGLYADDDGDRVQAFVVLNGMPIGNFKNKQVPPNCLAPARGSLFNQAVLLPAKSKIWIKTQSQFNGQAYLQILKL